MNKKKRGAESGGKKRSKGRVMEERGGEKGR